MASARSPDGCRSPFRRRLDSESPEARGLRPRREAAGGGGAASGSSLGRRSGEMDLRAVRPGTTRGRRGFTLTACGAGESVRRGGGGGGVLLLRLAGSVGVRRHRPATSTNRRSPRPAAFRRPSLAERLLLAPLERRERDDLPLLSEWQLPLSEAERSEPERRPAAEPTFFGRPRGFCCL